MTSGFPQRLHLKRNEPSNQDDREELSRHCLQSRRHSCDRINRNDVREPDRSQSGEADIGQHPGESASKSSQQTLKKLEGWSSGLGALANF